MSYHKADYLVQYEDFSELVYLPVEYKYVWLRPNTDRTKMKEVAIDATNQDEAMGIVREMRQKEVETL